MHDDLFFKHESPKSGDSIVPEKDRDKIHRRCQGSVSSGALVSRKGEGVSHLARFLWKWCEVERWERRERREVVHYAMANCIWAGLAGTCSCAVAMVRAKIASRT
jgi:hypothetical protein